MKNITFSDFNKNNLSIEKIDVAGFDLVVVDTQGNKYLVEEGLSELVFSNSSIQLASGLSVDYKSLVESTFADSNNLQALDINFVGDSAQVSLDGTDGTGVKEGFEKSKSPEFSEASDDEATNEDVRKFTEEEVNKMVEEAVKAAKAEESEAEDEPEDVKEDVKEQAAETNEHIEGMKNELRVEKVDKNENTSKLAGEYDTPPQSQLASSNTGKYKTEGEPKEEDQYEFKVNLKADTDSGAKGDFITNSKEPIFSGTGIPATLVTITINGASYSTKVDENGNWALPPISGLEEGDYAFTAIDNAGNKQTGSLTIDRTNTLSHDLQNDTGSSDSDGITQDARLVFVGKTDAGSTVVVTIAGKEYEAVANVDGDFTIRLPSLLPDGKYEYEIKSTDIAGNEMIESSHVIVDTIIEATVSLDPSMDSGVSDSDEITNVNENIVLAGVIEVGASAVLKFNGKQYPVDIKEDGSWSITIQGVLPDGAYDYVLEVTDPAGNFAEINGSIEIDTVTYLDGGLDALSDTGVSSSDGLTSDNLPTFSGVGEPNSKLVLQINGKQYQTKVTSGGRWEINVADVLPDGKYDYTLTLTDIAGNTQEIKDSITVDTGVVVSASLKTDTGMSSSDGITKNKDNTISGQTEAGATGTITIKAMNGGLPVELSISPDGSFEFETGDLPDGEHQYTIHVTDMAGNETSIVQKFVIDTNTHVTAQLSSSTDSGSSSDDNITNETNPIFEGTGEVGSEIRLTIGGKEYTTTVDENGRWKVNITSPLAHGEHSAIVIATDIAGNTKQTEVHFTVDTVAPEGFVVALDNDSGVSGSDWITNKGALALSGSVEAGCSVVVVVDGKRYGKGEGVNVGVDGSWSFTLPVELEDGTYKVEFIAEDVAGNTTKMVRELVVDTETFVDGGMSTSSDSGLSSSDNITNVTKPSFNGTAEAGSTVVVRLDGQSYDVVVGSDGLWVVNTDRVLADGTYLVSITVTDIAGNTETISESITIDTVAPVESTILLKNDSGVSAKDFITKNATPALHGVAEPESTVQIKVTFAGGDTFTYSQPDVVLNPVTGEWSFTSPIVFPEGTHSIEVISTDKAGNKSSAEQSITVDTSISLTAGLASGSDSGASSSDKLTNVQTPKIVGTGTAGDTVTVSINGNSYSTVIAENGKWEIQVTDSLAHRPEQPYEYEVTVTDVAGNTMTKTDTITVDTSTKVAGGLDVTSDSAAVDGITSEKRPLFSGTGEVGAAIELEIDGKKFETVVDEKGRWSIQLPAALKDGVYNYTIVSTDLAGNEATQTSSITIDSQTSVSGGLSVDSDSGDKDNITNINRPSFSGSGEVGATVTVTINGRDYSTVVASSGHWVLQISDTLPDAVYSYKISAVDIAGNESALPDAQITIDTQTFVTGGLASGYDTGASSQDKLTKFDSPKLAGTGEVGSTIVLTIGGREYRTQVDAQGQWEIDGIQKLEDGKHNYEIKIIDVAGNSLTIREHFTVDTTPPTFTPALLENDSGISKTDMITNNGGLIFVGKVEDVSTAIVLSINGKVYRSPDQIVISPDGSWRFELPEVLAESVAPYNFTITYIDLAGNEIQQAGRVTVDTTNTLTGELGSNSDSGVKGDKITNETSPTFRGTTDPKSVVTLVIDGKTYTHTAGADGNWAIQVGHFLSDGTYSYTLKSVDVAGNAKELTDTITIDTKPASLSNISLANDSSEEGDWVTKNSTPVWSGVIEAGANITITINGNGNTITLRSPNDFLVDEWGNWTVSSPEVLADGNYTVRFDAVDVAGNASFVEHNLVVDTVVFVEGRLTASSDTGASDSDKITANNKPSFSGIGEAGATVTLVIGGHSYTTVVGADQKWSIGVTELLPDGIYDVAISIEDLAGNIESVPSFNVTIDTTPPQIDSVKLISDSGSSNSDGVSNIKSPLFGGKTEVGSSVAIKINNKTYDVPSANFDADGNWTVQLPVELDDGVYRWEALVTDLAGNVSAIAGEITIDTVNTVTGGLSAGSDTGVSSEDNLTKDKTPEFSGKTEPFAAVKLVLSNGAEYLTTADANGNWSVVASTPLANGHYTYEIISTDIAGNESSTAGGFEVDFVAPSLTILLMNDTGASANDGITKSRMPVFSGTSERGASVEVEIAGITYSSPAVKVAEDGSWTFVCPIELADGEYSVVVNAVDMAGNASSSSFDLIIDNAIFLTGKLHADSDSGISNSDGITNEVNPIFEGRAEAGSTVTLAINGREYSVVIDSSELWEIEVGDALPDGVHDYVITVLDAAGNTQVIKDKITIDTSVSLVGRLDAGSDTGSSNSDKITSDNQPKFTGKSDAGATVTVTINGISKSAVVNSVGDWQIQWTEALEDGAVSVMISVVDVAGNEKSITEQIVIDTTPPEIPVVKLDNDSGLSGTDGISNNTRPQFSGNVEKGATVMFVIDGRTYSSPADISIAANGDWEFKAPFNLEDGDYSYTVIVVDLAGNKSQMEGSITIDTSFDMTVGLDGASDSGAKGDFITNIQNPTFGGSAEAGAKIELTINGKTYSTYAVADGTWALTLPVSLPHGVYNYTVKGTDVAGNTVETSGSLNIDVQTSLTGGLDNSSNSNLTSDLVTNATEIKFSGTGEPLADLSLTINGKTYQFGVDKFGRWEFVLPETLPEGSYSYVIVLTDIAGNTASLENTIVIDRTNFLNVSIKADSDSGQSDSDGITNNSRPVFAGLTQPNTEVTLVINSVSYDIVPESDGSFEFQLPDGLADGTYNYTFKSVDVAGNASTVKGKLVVDTVAELTGGLAAESDSGLIGDSLTSSVTPTFGGRGESGAVVVLTINNVDYQAVVDKGGEWSVTLPPEHTLADGKYNYVISTTDVAGNTKSITGTLAVDTVTNVNATMDSDTGVSSTDGITGENCPSFSGTMEVGASISLAIGGKTYTSANGIVVSSNGTWTFTVPPSDALPDGVYDWVVTVTDDAGNEATHSGEVVIDTTAPDQLTVNLLNGSVPDTSISKNPIPNFGGVTEVGTQITIKMNGVAQSDKQITLDADGNWTFVVPAALADGKYVFEVTATDVAGNSQTIKHELEIDTSTEVGGRLDEAFDSGKSSADQITNSEVIRFSGTGEFGSAVTLTINNMKYDVVVESDGTWVFDVPDFIGDGVYQYVIESTDRAGNTASHTDTVEIDRTNILTGGMNSASDTGVSDSDGITKVTNPTFKGTTQPDCVLKLSIAGGVYNIAVDASGEYEFTLPDALVDGTYSYTLTSEDTAGNVIIKEGQITIDTATSVQGGIDAETDTGVVGDNLTNSATPSFAGVGEPDATITLTINNKQYSVVVPASGEWKIAIPESDALVDGVYKYIIKSVDVAGNEDEVAGSVSVDLSTNVTAKMTTDSGQNSSDGFTKETCPSFAGTMEVGAKITLTINGKTYSETSGIVVNPDGSWSFDLPSIDALDDGSYEWVVKVLDAAGNSQSVGGVVVVDTLAPDQLTVSLLNGSVADTTVSSNSTPKFGGQTEVGTSITIKVNGVAQPQSAITIDDEGNWVFDAPSAWADGHYVVIVTATDLAGNSESITVPLEIDTQTGLVAGLDTADDHGFSSSDGITNSKELTFKGTAEAGAKITLNIDGKNFTTTVAADGSWSIEVGELDGSSDNVYEYTIVSEDKAGNKAEHTGSVVVDTKPPAVPNFELSAGSDSAQKGDWITNAETISIRGVGEAGARISVTVNGITFKTVVDESGAWAVDLGALPDGTHAISVVATDIAGNQSKAQETLVVDRSIDLSGGIASSSDSGSSDTDNYTNVKRPVIAGASDPYANITVTITGGGGEAIHLSVVAGADGQWAIAPSQYPRDLSDGVYEYKVDAVDAAGNTSSFSDKFTIDASIISTLGLADSTNSNVIGDTVTNFKNPRFEGAGDAGDTVTVVVYGADNRVVTTVSTEVGANNKWFVDVDVALSDGNYRVESIAVDKAGNTLKNEINITIDTKPPEGLAGGLDSASNTGDKKDTITKDNTPMFSGVVESGCVVQLVFGNGKVYNAIVGANGEWTAQVTQELPDGNYPYTIVATDLAGNTSEIKGEITIDSKIGLTGALDANSDTGWAGDDWVTKVNSPIYTGVTDPLSTVKVQLNIIPPKSISVIADVDGKFSLDLGDLFGANGTFPDGTHSLTITATDPAGNVVSVDKTLVVDTAAPSGLTLLLHSESDSGDKGDFITNHSAPILHGKCEVGDVRLVVRVNNVDYRPTIESDGSWQLPLPELADGVYRVLVTATDKAGNVSQAQKDLTIDTEAPTGITGRLSSASDAGSSSSDGVTNHKKDLRFDGMAEAKSSVVLIINGIEYKAVVSSDGKWSVTVPTTFDDGTYSARVKVTDQAGNVNDSTVFDFTVDTLAPTITDVKLRPSDDTGEDNSDGITNKQSPTIIGKSSNDIVEVYILIDGTSRRFEGVIGDNGGWSCKLSGMADGVYTYTVHVTDLAGNASELSGNTITIDTQNTLYASLDSASDSGSSTDDGITNVVRPTISGTTDVGNSLSLVVKDKNGATVWSDTLKAISTSFAFKVNKNLADGQYSWDITSIDAAGNSKTESGVFVVDTVSKVTAGLHASSDTGTVGDNITNLPNPILTGVAENGSVVTIKLSGVFGGTNTVKTYTTTANSSGSWSYTIPDELSHGDYSYTVTAVDKAGNLSEEVNGVIKVDRVPPTVAGWLVTDTGASSSDGITSGVMEGALKGHLDFAGTTGNEATQVVITIGGRNYTTTPRPDGTWEFVIPDKLADNKYNYSIYSMDAAGNKSPTITGTVTLDTRINGLASLSQDTDSGIQADNITNITKPILSGSGEGGLKLTASLTGGGLTNVSLGNVTADGNGNWTLKIGDFIGAGLLDGAYVVTFEALDLAGNTGSFTYRFTIDTTPPDLVLNKHNNAEVTTDKPPITGSGESGSTVYLVIDGDVYSTKVNGAGRWAFGSAELPSFPDGEIEYYVYAVDVAGNRSENITDSVFVNTGTYVDGWLDASIDTGLSDTDGITQNRTPVFTGTGESGGTVTVVIRDANGKVIATPSATVDRNGLWTIALDPSLALADGAYKYVIEIVDSTGNTASVEEKDLVIDNAISILGIRPSESSWGGSFVDGIWHLGTTSNRISGTLANKDKGAEIRIVINGKEYVGVSDKNGDFYVGLGLPDGLYHADVYITDLAGNQTQTSFKIRVDTVAQSTFVNEDDLTGDGKNWVINTSRPTFSGVCDSITGRNVQVQLFGDKDYYFDANVSNGRWSITPPYDLPDGMYSYRIIYWEQSGRWIEQRGTLLIDTTNEVLSINGIERVYDAAETWTSTKISGFAEPNAQISLVFNGQTYSTTVNSGGKWFINLPITANGTYSITVNSTDKAGNTVKITDHDLVVDFIDNLTVDVEDGDVLSPVESPWLSGTGDEGSSIRVILVDALGNRIVKYAAVGADGKWSINISDLADGEYSVTIIASSNLGNKEITTTIVVDGTPPAIEFINLDSDTGVVGDGITSVTSPTFSGKVEAGTSKVIFAIGGVIYTSGVDFSLAADGSWTFTVPAALADGTYEYKVTAYDSAGNKSSQSGTVEVMSTPPALSGIEVDGGVLVDGVLTTNSQNPSLSGVATGADVVTITINGVDYVSGVDFELGANGEFKFDFPAGLADGHYTITITASNGAGLKDEAVIDVAVDRVPPELGEVTLVDDTGVEGDWITTSNTPTLAGVVVGDFDRVTITLGDVTYVGGVDFVVNADGSWVFTAPSELVDGVHDYLVSAVDKAGNETTASGSITVQNQAPVFSGLEVNGKPVDESGFATNNGELEFEGKVEGSESVTITIGDIVLESGVDFYLFPDGSWNFTIPDVLPEGEYEIIITSQNAAGATTSTTIPVVVDTTAPVGTGSFDADGNDFVGDGVISNTRPVFSGVGEAGATVTVSIGSLSHSVTVSKDGQWSLEFPVDLPDGKHLFVIEMIDAAGNSTQLDFDMFWVDTSTVGVGVAEAAYEQEVSVNFNGVSEITGVAEFGDVIEVTVAGVGSPLVTEAGVSGAWAVTLPADAPIGHLDYVAFATDMYGAERVVQNGVITKNIDSGEQLDSVELLASGDELSLSGSADANTDVVVVADGNESVVTAGSDGVWAVQLPLDVVNVSVYSTQSGDKEVVDIDATKARQPDVEPIHLANLSSQTSSSVVEHHDDIML